MPEKPAGERTEKATPRKRRTARREGQIGNTPEVGSWLGLLAASFVIPRVVSSLMTAASAALVQAGAVAQNPDPGQALKVARTAFEQAAEAFAPLVLLVLGIAVGSVVLQGGFAFAPKLFTPKFSRLNPLHGLKRMFGPHGAWTALKSLIKSGVLALVVYLSVRSLVPTLASAGSLPLSSLLSVAVDAVLQLVRWCAVAGLVMAFADYAVVRRRNNRSLKMTKQEIKDEMKSSEGNPQLRGAIRSRALAISRNRMLADVASADVVVVNPTHVAVALRYEAGQGAPRVVAKGADSMAARIREIAQNARVPMVEDVPLARTLYQVVDVGREIPGDLFEGVARVLAFIMTLKARGSVAGTHKVRPLVRR
jgi:flagellar biosynthesis protein FlhB